MRCEPAQSKAVRRRVRYAALKVSVVAAAIVLVLAACATGGASSASSASSLPSWYLDPKSVYPDDQYLTAVGTGDSRRDAEQQAMAGLTQTFEARVSVDQRTRERYSEIMSTEGAASETEIQLLQNTRVQSGQTLLNVQFGEAAVDDSGRVHSIAYLERAPTAAVYGDLIGKNANQVQRYLQQADAASSALAEYAYLSAASVVARANEVLIDQLRIISPGNPGGQVPYDVTSVVQRHAEVGQRLTTSVQVDGAAGERVASVVRQAIGADLFPIGTQNPVLSVQGRADFAPAESGDNFESVEWTLTLDLRGPDGRSLVTLQEEDRSSGVSEEAATAFAYADMEDVIRDEFVAAVQRYFEQLVVGN